jgi:hypothetical protein
MSNKKSVMVLNTEEKPKVEGGEDEIEEEPETETEDTRRRDELLDAATYELEQQLQLTTTDISEEKASLLIDLLRVQFMDIMKSLETLRMSRDDLQIDMQAERVKQWLKSLNRSPFVPLSFRIKYLKMLEDYLDVMPRDMGSQVMRAYKIGVVMIKDKARKKPSLYQDMVYVTGIAVQLSLQALQRDSSNYLPPSPLDVRQSFEMARLGLTIARTLDQKKAKTDIYRLKNAMIQHELLRRLDLCRLTLDEQQILFKRLPEFAAYADIAFLRAGEKPQNTQGKAWLISRLEQPHLKPRRSTNLSDIDDMNIFLIRGQKLLDRVIELVRYQPKKDNDTSGKLGDGLHLEHVFAELHLCSTSLLRTFKKTPRPERKVLKDKGRNLFARIALVLKEELYIEDPYESFRSWKVMDLSDDGISLEGRHKAFPVGSLVEIKFAANSSRFGMVRWYRSSLQGVVQCGIKFAPSKLFPAKVALLNNSAAESMWLALLEKTATGWNVWMGEWTGTPVPMTVSIKRHGQARIICYMLPEGRIGANYAVFTINKVMSEDEYHMVSAEDKKKENEGAS